MDAIDLFWIPLGAGGHVVCRCGKAYEAITAALAHRPRAELFHAAVEVHVAGQRYVIEQAPVPAADRVEGGVVAGGPVGFPAAGRWRIFRYEIRRWPDGVIPDLAWAVGGPRRVTTDAHVARAVL